MSRAPRSRAAHLSSEWLSEHKPELLVRTTFHCLNASRASGGRPTKDEIIEKGTRVLEHMLREYARADDPFNVPKKGVRFQVTMISSVRGWCSAFRRSWPNDINWLFVEDAFIVALHKARNVKVSSTSEKSMNALERSLEEHNIKKRASAMDADLSVSDCQKDSANLREPTYKQKAPLWCRRYRPDLIMRTVLCLLSEGQTPSTLNNEEVTARGKYLLKVMTTEYSEHGEVVTCASQWQWRVDDFYNRVLSFLRFITNKWPRIDWHMFSDALHDHVLLIRKRSVMTTCET